MPPPMKSAATSKESSAPPTRLAKQWVRYVVGFGVGTVVGMAPYLGTLDVPLFKPLLTLYPITLQGRLIPLSAAVMGLTAAAIQWYAGEYVKRPWLRAWFVGATGCFLASVVVLLLIRSLFVVDVPIQGGSQHVAFVIGLTRLPNCPCAQASDALCISETLTLNPAQIDACWGSRAVRFGELLLQLNYLFAVGSFGVVTGLLVLREALSRKITSSRHVGVKGRVR